MKKVYFLLIALLIATITLPGNTQDLVVTDLGQVGKVTPLKNLESIKKDNEEFHRATVEPMKENLKKKLRHVIELRQQEFKELLSSTDFSFHTSLPRYYGKPKTAVKYIESMELLPWRGKILFFSWEDTIKPEKLKDINAAYCLSYNNLGDIKKWKEKHKVIFPVQPLEDDDICRLLGIEAYPAIVTIKEGGKLEVTQFQEGL